MTRRTFPLVWAMGLVWAIAWPGAAPAAPPATPPATPPAAPPVTQGWVASTRTSCNARVNAIKAYDKLELPFGAAAIASLQKELDDPCPRVQAEALFVLKRIGTAHPRHGLDLKRIRKLAGESPFYYVRCAALRALGRLRDRQAEPLMATALSLGVSLVLQGEGGTYHLSPGTLPQCAVWALMRLHGQSLSPEGDRLQQQEAALRLRLKHETRIEEQKSLLRALFKIVAKRFSQRTPEPTMDDIQKWREQLRARGLGTPGPAATCLTSHGCPLGHACVSLRCVPIAEAFRRHAQYTKARGTVGRPDSRVWRNADAPEAVRVGLGLRTVDFLERIRPPGTSATTIRLTESELTSRVSHLWLSGRCGEAIPLALRGYRLRRASFLRSVLGMCACQTGNLALARWARDRSPPSLRPVLVRMCKEKGLTLGTPGGGALTDPPPQ